MINAERYHDISCGHRVVGHENKCAHLHGHNYRFHFTVEPMDGLDDIGRVLDFSVIKSNLCEFLEDAWDHKMLIWSKDPYLETLAKLAPQDIVVVPFNPTAENMAKFLVEVVGPEMLKGTDTVLTKVKIDETRKCSAPYAKGQ